MSQDPYIVVFPIFERVTQLDLCGPAQVLSCMPNTVIHLAAATLEPISTDSGFSLLPTTTFADCPKANMLCVPGGPGTVHAMSDVHLLRWLRSQSETAELITSVCTGSLILAAAGLLSGYRSATHWAFRDVLKNFDAQPVPERVVVDRNRITGGGVTAGIDFAFTIIKALRGPKEAEIIRLLLEYDPAPLQAGGIPEKVSPDILRAATERLYSHGLGERVAIMRDIANTVLSTSESEAHAAT